LTESDWKYFTQVKITSMAVLYMSVTCMLQALAKQAEVADYKTAEISLNRIEV